MELISPNINIDFVGKRFFFVVFSVAINLLSIVLLLTWGLNYGLDFSGGAMIEVRFAQPTTCSERSIYLPYNRFTNPLSSISLIIDASMKSLGLGPLA